MNEHGTTATRAGELFAKGYSCSQAVCGAFATAMDLPEDAALRLGSTFGGGMGRMGEACGALTGGLMVLGAARGNATPDPVAKARAGAIARQLTDAFLAEHGALRCRDLLGCDISTPEKHDQAREQGAFAHCAVYVASSAQTVARILDATRDTGEGR